MLRVRAVEIAGEEKRGELDEELKIVGLKLVSTQWHRTTYCVRPRETEKCRRQAKRKNINGKLDIPRYDVRCSLDASWHAEKKQGVAGSQVHWTKVKMMDGWMG